MRTVILTILTVIFFFSFAFSQTQEATTNDGKKIILNSNGTWKYAESKTDTIKKQEIDNIVYVTSTGKKYHTASCSYLKGGGIPKKLSEVKDTYSPCSRCNPTASSTSVQTSQSNSQTTNSNQVSPKQTTTKETPNGKNSSGRDIYTGPRGGVYHYSKSGKKFTKERENNYRQRAGSLNAGRVS